MKVETYTLIGFVSGGALIAAGTVWPNFDMIRLGIALGLGFMFIGVIAGDLD